MSWVSFPVVGGLGFWLISISSYIPVKFLWVLHFVFWCLQLAKIATLRYMPGESMCLKVKVPRIQPLCAFINATTILFPFYVLYIYILCIVYTDTIPKGDMCFYTIIYISASTRMYNWAGHMCDIYIRTLHLQIIFTLWQEAPPTIIVLT